MFEEKNLFLSQPVGVIVIRNAMAFLEFPSLGHHENKFSHGLTRKYKLPNEEE